MGRHKAIKPFKGRLSRSGHVSGGPMEDAGFRYGRGDFFYLFVCLIPVTSGSPVASAFPGFHTLMRKQ